MCDSRIILPTTVIIPIILYWSAQYLTTTKLQNWMLSPTYLHSQHIRTIQFHEKKIVVSKFWCSTVSSFYFPKYAKFSKDLPFMHFGKEICIFWLVWTNSTFASKDQTVWSAKVMSKIFYNLCTVIWMASDRPKYQKRQLFNSQTFKTSNGSLHMPTWKFISIL